MSSSTEPQNAASNLKSALLTALAYFGSEHAKSEKSETTQKDGTTGRDIKPDTEPDVNSYRSTKARSDTHSSNAESPANTGKQYKPGDNQPDTNVKVRPEALSSKNQPAPTEPPGNQNKSQSQPSIQPKADQAISDAKTKPDAATLRVNSQTPSQESTQNSDTEIRQQNGLKVNQQVIDSGNKSEIVNLRTTTPVSSEPAKASGTDTETRQQIQLKADQNISDTKSNTESANSKIKIPTSAERTDAQIKVIEDQTATNKQDGAKTGESIAALKARIESSNKATFSASPKSPVIPDSEYENTKITNKPVSAKTGENIAILKARLASLSTKGNIPVSPELQSSTLEKNSVDPDNAKQASQSRPYGNVTYLKARPPDAPGSKPNIPSPSEPADTVGQEKMKQQVGAKPNENIAYLKTKLAALNTNARTEIARISVNSPASKVSGARTGTQNPEPENVNVDKKTLPETDPNSVNVKENQKTPDTKTNPPVPVSPDSSTLIKSAEPENTANADQITKPETDEIIKTLKNELESLSKELLSQLQFTTKGNSPSEIENYISRVKNSIPIIPHRVVELINDTLKEIHNAIENSQPSPLIDKRPLPLTEESSSILKAIASSNDSDFKRVLEQILTKIENSGPIERDTLPRIERLLFDLRQFIVKSLPEPMMMISELLAKTGALIKSSGENTSPLMMFAFNTAAEASRDFILDIFNEISADFNFDKTLPFANGQVKSSANGSSTEAVDISSGEMSFSPPAKFLLSNSALDITKSLQEMTREVKMLLSSIPRPVSEDGPEFSPHSSPDFSRNESPAPIPQTLSSFTSKVQEMIQKTLQKLSSLADLSTDKSRPAQSATGPLRAISARETTENFDSVKKQPDKNTSAALDNFSTASVKAIEKLSIGLKEEVERIASESTEKEIAGFRFEGKSGQGKMQLPVQKAMLIIQKAVDEIIGKLSHLQEAIRELPEKAQHSERGERKEIVDLSRENRAPGPEKENGPDAELSSGMRQMVRQSVDSLLNRLESLQLLARQVNTSSGEQQILALPMKIGGEWTEVNIRFLKKRQAEKTTQKQNHFSVYLNVAPSMLGAISVNMEYELKKELRLQIEFENNDTKVWFSRNSDSLRQALRELNLPLTQFEIRPAKNKSEPDIVQEISESAIDLKV